MDRSITDRRKRALVAVSGIVLVLSTMGGGVLFAEADAQPGSSCIYAFEQPEEAKPVYPIRDEGNPTVESFYGVGGYDSDTPIDIEEEGTSFVFLYQGSDGDDDTSLVAIHDKPGGTGGAVDFLVNVTHATPDPLHPLQPFRWVIQDDHWDFDGNRDLRPTWIWGPANDGTAMKVDVAVPLDDPDDDNGEGLTQGAATIEIEALWNEDASRDAPDGGEIQEWTFLSASPDGSAGPGDLQRYALDMDEDLTVKSACV